MNKSRSLLYATALAEYLARHRPELVTRGVERVGHLTASRLRLVLSGIDVVLDRVR